MLYKRFSILLGLPKSIYINFKYFKVKDAIRLPIILSHKVSLTRVLGSVKINAPIKTGIIQIGFNDVGIFDRYKRRSIWRVSGSVIFNGKTNLGHGSKISVGENGKLSIGKNVCISAESAIVCEKEITIGDDVLISWDNLIMDTDFHPIYDIKNRQINKDKSIIIGNKVWIGCRNTILKGTNIKENTVVGASSVISSEICKKNVIVAGNPPKIVKENILW